MACRRHHRYRQSKWSQYALLSSSSSSRVCVFREENSFSVLVHNWYGSLLLHFSTMNPHTRLQCICTYSIIVNAFYVYLRFYTIFTCSHCWPNNKQYMHCYKLYVLYPKQIEQKDISYWLFIQHGLNHNIPKNLNNFSGSNCVYFHMAFFLLFFFLSTRFWITTFQQDLKWTDVEFRSTIL